MPNMSLIGPVVSLVGFKLYLDVTLNMALSTNHTQCIDLEVQKTDVQVKSVSLQIVETYVRPFFSFSGSTGLHARMSLLLSPPVMSYSQSNGVNDQ
jgi:hypothetical protein